jgi:hypothetical protein
MIIKMSDGSFYELTKNEYTNFIAEMLVHFNTENKLTVNHIVDTRVEAAKLLLNTVAQNQGMKQDTKDDYFKIAFELIEQYNFELMANGKEPIKAKDLAK